MEDVQRDDIFNRANLRRSLRFVHLKTFRRAGGIGTIAAFEVTIPGLLKLRDCKLRRRTGEPLRLVTGRLECGGFAVELRPWLCEAILEGAVAALREKLQNDLAALAIDAARVGEVDTLPVAMPPPDAAALPEQLMGQVGV